MLKRVEQVLKRMARNVKALRLARGLSQEELALRAGVDRTYISQIERGICNPSLIVLIKIAETLRVEVQELLDKSNGVERGNHNRSNGRGR